MGGMHIHFLEVPPTPDQALGIAYEMQVIVTHKHAHPLAPPTEYLDVGLDIFKPGTLILLNFNSG